MENDLNPIDEMIVRDLIGDEVNVMEKLKWFVNHKFGFRTNILSSNIIGLERTMSYKGLTISMHASISKNDGMCRVNAQNISGGIITNIINVFSRNEMEKVFDGWDSEYLDENPETAMRNMLVHVVHLIDDAELKLNGLEPVDTGTATDGLKLDRHMDSDIADRQYYTF